jgi:hypothetical protein
MSKEIRKSNMNLGGVVLTVGMGLMALFGLSGCKNPASDNPCTCSPNGKVHEVGENCCAGDNCTCASKALDWNITLVDQTGGLVTADHIRSINSILNDLDGQSYASTVKGRNNVILNIISGSTYSTIDGNTVEMGIAKCESAYPLLLGTLNAILGDLADLPPTASINRLNSNIRLASGKTSNQFFAKQVAQQVKLSRKGVSHQIS